MARLRSKKGHIATAIFSFFFFFCLFFFYLLLFFFLSHARLLPISRKPLDIKLPNLNMFVWVKIYVSNFFFAPRSKKSSQGPKKSKNKWPEWSGELSVSLIQNLEGTREIGIKPFSSQFANFHQMREQEGPQNWILIKKPHFSIFNIF